MTAAEIKDKDIMTLPMRLVIHCENSEALKHDILKALEFYNTDIGRQVQNIINSFMRLENENKTKSKQLEESELQIICLSEDGALQMMRAEKAELQLQDIRQVINKYNDDNNYSWPEAWADIKKIVTEAKHG